MGDCFIVLGIIGGAAFMFWAGCREGGRQERKWRYMQQESEERARKMYGPKEEP